MSMGGVREGWGIVWVGVLVGINMDGFREWE